MVNYCHDSASITAHNTALSRLWTTYWSFSTRHTGASSGARESRPGSALDMCTAATAAARSRQIFSRQLLSVRHAVSKKHSPGHQMAPGNMMSRRLPLVLFLACGARALVLRAPAAGLRASAPLDKPLRRTVTAAVEPTIAETPAEASDRVITITDPALEHIKKLRADNGPDTHLRMGPLSRRRANPRFRRRARERRGGSPLRYARAETRRSLP